MEKTRKQTKEFQAETKQLLDLMIHSIYTNREIFLRELISNASDALDKIRFQALTEPRLLEGDSATDLHIFLAVDEAGHSLTISDNGLGMTFDEVVENIGTIAKSGTKAFLEKFRSQGESTEKAELIGQFGVGFYSAFMVSDKVTLITKAPGEAKAVKWESTGDGTYTIEETTKETRGTSITLYINEEYRSQERPAENFLNQYTLENLVKKYSDYIRYPIKMKLTKEEKPLDENGKPIAGAKPVQTSEIRTLNSMTPLWMKNKTEINSEEYNKFYQNVFHDWTDPLDIIHSKVEGVVEYTALLFIPSHAPFDFYTRDYQQGIKLYSRNVFIMDNCRDLLPEHLRFVRGLVDSADFSLNISREILQQDKQLKIIGKNLEKSVLKALENLLQKDRPKYETFWKEFGRAIKAGIYMDFTSREKLQDLLLFPSSGNSPENLTTLEEYLKRMPAEQSEIYYAAGKDRETVERLPQMEVLREKGYEVLYLFDKVDEFAVDSLHEYRGKHFKSISRGDLNLNSDQDKEAKKAVEELGKENEPLLKAVKEQLGGKVAEVRLSNRLKTSAVCLVSGENGISLQMEQILAEMDQKIMRASRILELNPGHPLFAALKKIYEKDPAGAKFKDYVELLYGQALLLEGLGVEDPLSFADKVAALMVEAENTDSC
ncbi:MAG: molecular chaperone HtpG [Bacillota bacterium]